MINKTNLRKEILEKRKLLNIDELSLTICNNIKAIDVYKKAKHIFAFYPMKYEVNIKPLFEDNSKTFYIPRVSNDDLLFFKYQKKDDLEKSNFGVLEPKADTNESNIIPDLIIVPAVAIDKNNFRLGYGKGFYDRFLNKNKYKNVVTITPIFSSLIVDSVCKESHDKKIDIVITE